MARDNKHQRIVDAAVRLFTTRQFHEITLDEVAAAAGVGKGTIYRYFHDKDDLFIQTAFWGLDELCDLVKRNVPAEGGFSHRLLEACQQIVAFFQRRRQLFRIMQTHEDHIFLTRGGPYDRWLRRRRVLVEAVAEIIRAGVAEGRIRDDVPAAVLADFFLGLVRTRVRDLAGVPAAFRCDEMVVEIFCRGAQRIGPIPPPRSPRGGPARGLPAAASTAAKRKDWR